MLKETISSDKSASAVAPYSPALRVDNLVFISGQIPLIPSSGELNNETFYDQTSQVIDNLEAICREIGGGLDNILKLTIFLTDLEKFDEVNQIMSKRFSEPFPARATIEISKLPKGVDIEMDAILSIEV